MPRPCSQVMYCLARVHKMSVLLVPRICTGWKSYCRIEYWLYQHIPVILHTSRQAPACSRSCYYRCIDESAKSQIQVESYHTLMRLFALKGAILYYGIIWCCTTEHKNGAKMGSCRGALRNSINYKANYCYCLVVDNSELSEPSCPDSSVGYSSSQGYTFKITKKLSPIQILQ